MKNSLTLLLLIFYSLTLFSQGIEFPPGTNYVAKNSVNGKAFEVSKENIVTSKYKYDLIDNPVYLSRIKKIDSLQEQINELKKGKNSLFGGLNSKKSKNENEIEKLNLQIKNLEKDIPPRNAMTTGRTFAIPAKIRGYIPVGERKREILIIDYKNVANQLEGNIFNKEIRTSNGSYPIYRLINKDTLHFKKNELIVRDSIRKYFYEDFEKLSTEVGILIKRESDNSIFCVDSNFKNDLIEQSKYDLLNLLDDLGIVVETSQNHNRSVLVKDGKKCVLTEEIVEYLVNNKNADIIYKVNNSVTQYRSYLKQQTDISLKITKHIEAYKSYLMTNSRRSEWEKDTKAAITIQNNMKKLPYYNSIPFQLEIEESKLSSANMDIIQASRNSLGI